LYIPDTNSIRNHNILKIIWRPIYLMIIRQSYIFRVLQEAEIIEVKKTDLRLDRLVRAEKLQLLFKQSFPAVPISFLVAILLCAILLPVKQKSLLQG